MLPIADAHVDVLLRMDEKGAPFAGTSPLAAGLQQLREGHVQTQVFALFVWPRYSELAQMERVLRGVDLFYDQVARDSSVLPVRSKSEFETALASQSIAGLLSIEGGGCLCGQPGMLRVMHRLGVRGMGLTWNDANALADGCGEPRNGGLTRAGREVVSEMEKLGMWIDIAHLADRGVDDIFALVDGPVMASHANARSVHAHRRNLTDDVIREIVRRKGFIGLTFEASFLNDVAVASVDDVLRHLDHMLHLGAERCVGFGSDFDGASNVLPGLAKASDYGELADRLERQYGRDLASQICHVNFERFVMDSLPASDSTQ